MLGIYFVSTDVESAVVIGEPDRVAQKILLARESGLEGARAQLIGWAILEEHSRTVCANYEQES